MNEGKAYSNGNNEFEENASDGDLRVLFERTAPSAAPLDVDVLWLTAKRRTAKRLNPTGCPDTRLQPRLLQQSASSSSGLGRRRIGLRIVAGLVIAGIVAWSLFLLVPDGGSIAFGDVQEEMRKHETVTCTLTRYLKGKQPETSRMMALGANVARVERPDGRVVITDFKRQKILEIMPAKKKAVVLQGLALPEMDLYNAVRNVQKDATKRLPERDMDGKRAIGFVVPLGGNGPLGSLDTEVWVDVETRLPIRMESSSRGQDGERVMHQVVSDLVFDSQIDESLFSLTPPPGYTVETRGTAKPLPPESDEDDEAVLVATPLVGIGRAKFGMSKEDVIKAIGKPDVVLKEGSEGHEALMYYARGFQLSTHPKMGAYSIVCMTQKMFLADVRDFKGKTSEGIAMGASLKEIVEAYGKPDKQTARGQMMDVSYTKLRLSFLLADDKLVQMYLRPPRKQRKR